MNEEDHIQEIIMEQLDIDESLWHRNLTFDELAVDSLQLLELVVNLEQAFDLDLDDEKLADCETVGEAMDLVLASLGADL